MTRYLCIATETAFQATSRKGCLGSGCLLRILPQTTISCAKLTMTELLLGLSMETLFPIGGPQAHSYGSMENARLSLSLTLSPLMEPLFYSELRKECLMVRSNGTLHPIKCTDTGN